MKRTLFFTAMVMFMASATLMHGQSTAVDKLFDKYGGQDGFTTVEVSKGLFELFSEIEADDPEFEDFQKAVEGIESLRLIAFSDEEGNASLKDSFLGEVKNSVPFSEFKELMVVKDKEANINFYAKNKNQVITEMIMIVDGDKEAVLMSMTGNLDLNYVAKLGKSMNIKGMEHLGKMKKDE